MQITRKSILSGETRTREIDVTKTEMANWQNGMLIQDAMPNLSAEDREFILSGITPEEWETLKSEDE